MASTTNEQIISIRKNQNDFFRSGATLDIKFRKSMLKKFLKAMEK